MPPSNISLSTDERRTFNHLYTQADKEELGVLTGDKAIVFFDGSNLPGHTLGEIWQLVDKEDTGFLTKEAFYIVCRLIGHAQAGKTPSDELFDRPGPLPWFKGITIPGLAKQPSPPSQSTMANLAPGSSGTPSRQASTSTPAPPPPTAATASPAPSRSGSTMAPSALSASKGGVNITPEDKAKYSRLFYNAGPVAGLLDGDKASEILKKSRLPDAKLGQIWTLADTQSRGALDAGDFVIAMALIQQTMNGSLPHLPLELPDSVYSQAGAIKPNSQLSTSAPAPMNRPGGNPPVPGKSSLPPVSPVRTQYTGQRAAGMASPVYPQSTGSMLGPRRSSTLAQSQSSPWAITPLEKSQSDTFFGMLDTARSGSISGDLAGPFFLQSGLSGDILASVWDLSDIKNEGRLDRDEFALARRLIMDTLAGKQLPERLEESFIPPSMRDAWRATQQQSQPQSEVQRDLFSLMDDDEPAASLPEPAAAVGFSAFAPQPQALARVASPAPLQPTSNGGSPRAYPAPIVPTSTGGSGKSVSTRSPPPPIPLSRGISSLSSPTVPPSAPKHGNDFFDAASEEGENTDTLAQSAEVGNLQNQVSQTQRSVSNLRGQKAKLSEDVNKIEAQISELKVSLSQAKAAYDVESTNMTNLETRQKKGSEELKELREQTITAESDLSGLKEQKIEVEQGILKDKEEMRDIKLKLKSNNDEIASLKEQLEKTRKDARQQKGMLVVNKKQLATSEGEKEKVQRSITEEEAEARRARSASIPAPPAIAFSSSPREEMRSPPLSVSNRASPALSTPSARSNNPFDRMINAAAFGAAAALPAVGLAVPAVITNAAKSASPLQDAFSAAPEEKADETVASPHRPAEEEQDPFGMSTSIGSLPPQQQTATNNFGFDDDFGSAFDSFPPVSNVAAQKSIPLVTESIQSAEGTGSDFDSAFADFDQPSRRAPPPPPQMTAGQSLPARGESELGNVRSVPPAVAQPSIEAFDADPSSRQEANTRTQASVSDMSETPAYQNQKQMNNLTIPEAGRGAGAGLDRAEPFSENMSPLSSTQPYDSRELPSEDNIPLGDEEEEDEVARGLPPISEMERPDSPDSDSEEEEQTADTPVRDLQSSSEPASLGNNDQAVANQGKGKGRAIDSYPGAYPTSASDEEDAFEDARANLTERSVSPTVRQSSPSPPAPVEKPFTYNYPSLNFNSQEKNTPTYVADDASNSERNETNQPIVSRGGFANASTMDSSFSAPADSEVIATHNNNVTAGFAETGMMAAREAERPKAVDDFDDFEDLAPAHMEKDTSKSERTTLSTDGGFDDAFDDDFGFDKQTFSHTITSAGVGKATLPQGQTTTEAYHGSLPLPGARSEPSTSLDFGDSFGDAFNIPTPVPVPTPAGLTAPMPAPAGRSGSFQMYFTDGAAVSAASPGPTPSLTPAPAPVSSRARPAVGFDDDFFDSPSSRSQSTVFANDVSSVRSATPTAPVPAQAEDRSYIAPPPGSPTLESVHSQQPELRQAPPPPQQQQQQQRILQPPPLPRRTASDDDLPAVKELMQMGFDKRQAISALEDNQFDLGRAANALLSVNQ